MPWVVQDKKTGKYLAATFSTVWTKSLQKAAVFPTREASASLDERNVKVEIVKKG